YGNRPRGDSHIWSLQIFAPAVTPKVRRPRDRKERGRISAPFTLNRRDWSTRLCLANDNHTVLLHILRFGRLLRQDRKSAAASRTVHREVPPIEREDAGEIFAFGDPDQRGVGEVHRQVAILLHQLAHARRIAFIERRQRQRPGFHTAPEGLL